MTEFEAIKTKCCGVYLAACGQPNDRDWQKEYRAKGYEIVDVTSEELRVNFRTCKCSDNEQKEDPEYKNPNQLQLF